MFRYLTPPILSFPLIQTSCEPRSGDRAQQVNSQQPYLNCLVAERNLSARLFITDLKISAAAMTQSHGENHHRTTGGIHQIGARMHSQSLLAMKRVRNIKRNDVKGFFIRNSFVLFTISAVIIGEWEKFSFYLRHCSDLPPSMKALGFLHHPSNPLF